MNYRPLAKDIDGRIGQRIRERREALGMSQGDLAAVLGLSFSQVQKYEKGSNRIGAGHLYVLALKLETTPAALYAGIDAPPGPGLVPRPVLKATARLLDVVRRGGDGA